MSNAFIDGLGALLAHTREEQGISQADAAQRLKLSVRQIEAIEAEDWPHLPGEVFRRGFVRNYARLLELNPDDLVRPVDAEATATHTITAPSEGLTIGRSPITRWVALPLAALLLFLLVVALLYQWLRQGEQALVSPVGLGETLEPPQAVTPAVPSPPAESPPVGGQQPLPATPETGEEGTVVLPLPLNPQPVSQPTSQPVSQPSADTAALGKAAAEPQGKPSPGSAPLRDAATSGNAARETRPAATEATVQVQSGGSAALRFSTSDDAWVQVLDGKGQRFSKLVRAGTQEQLSGQPPFKLVVGNAAQVKLTYNGHQIDLRPFIGEKVARLTLE